MTKDNAPTADTSLLLVGVGASAGGIGALEQLFAARADCTNMAFIVVTHLMNGKPSMLAEIISRHTDLQVLRATDGMRIEAATIHVMQPDTVISVAAGKLRVEPADEPRRGAHTEIDLLFGSLAEQAQSRAVGVVLSGTGTDGALGCRAIREHGGLTIAQAGDGTPVQFTGMPDSAVAAHAIDLQLPAEAMLARICSSAQIPGHLAEVVAPRHDTLRQRLCELLLQRTGHDFSGYKSSTFWRRTERRMKVRELDDVDDYIQLLEREPEEATLFFGDLLISVTSFFRDTAAFETLRKEAIPELFRERAADRDIRVWVPGCATGEEAYSLAILLLEYISELERDDPDARRPAIKIFATDIDTDALSIARAGSYPAALLEGVSEQRRQRYFTVQSGCYVINKQVRELCSFSSHSLLKDPPFSRIDLVSCRNLLIYLGQQVQDQVMPIFHYALRPSGILFVGIAESASRHAGLFEPISRKHRIFRRVATATPRMMLPLGIGQKRSLHDENILPSSPRSLSNLRRALDAHMLRAHTPAYVLVNPQGEAMFYSANTGAYIEHATGAPSRQLLNAARKELRLGLRRALQETVRTRQATALPRTTLIIQGSTHVVDVCVEPFEQADGEQLFLVLFRDLGEVQPTYKDDSGTDVHDASGPAQELRDAREELQSTYEEFETVVDELRLTNEELSSVNEELQSSNEELETSKEELQSLNEELQTVNHDLSQSVELLDQSNAELRGLLESTQIATVFLDRHLCVRSFTPAATDIFNLIATDRGRAITDIAHKLDRSDLQHLLETTLRTGNSHESAVASKSGDAHYLMRIVRYSADQTSNSGVLITLIDVTALSAADARHRVMIGELNHRVRNMLSVISAVAMQTLSASTDEEAMQAFLARLQAMARTYKLLTRGHWRQAQLQDLLAQELGAVVDAGRFELAGPAVALNAKATVALGMTFHELTTNAVKYGALSTNPGKARVSWRVDGEGDGDGRALHIDWHEMDGPTVQPPARQGFGTRLIERQLAFELDGTSSVRFDSTGLSVDMRIPCTALQEEHPPEMHDDH